MPDGSLTEIARGARGRMTFAEKATRGGMTEGRIWVEVYLPFDPDAFNAFAAKAAEFGTGPEAWRAAQKADPELASKALTPIDAQGEFMLAAELQELADTFLIESRAMDAMHDQRARKSLSVVGSFLNSPEIESPHFWPGAWVLVFKVKPGTPEFVACKNGTFNAVSFMAVVNKVTVAPQGVPSLVSAPPSRSPAP